MYLLVILYFALPWGAPELEPGSYSQWVNSQDSMSLIVLSSHATLEECTVAARDVDASGEPDKAAVVGCLKPPSLR